MPFPTVFLREVTNKPSSQPWKCQEEIPSPGDQIQSFFYDYFVGNALQRFWGERKSLPG